jgi:hypothetical protein
VKGKNFFDEGWLLNWEREILLLHCERESGSLQKWEIKRLLEQNRKECLVFHAKF